MLQNKYWYFLQASLHFSGILLNNENLSKMLFDTMNKYEYACMTVVKTKYCVFSSFFWHVLSLSFHCISSGKVLNYWGLEGRHFLTGGDWVFPLFWNTFWHHLALSTVFTSQISTWTRKCYFYIFVVDMISQDHENMQACNHK